ncbi:MAG: hypothetical protein ACYC3X_00985 [Pirellulaceae bacterium]
MKHALLFVAFVCLVSVGCQSHARMANRNCQTCGSAGGHGQYSQRGAGCNPQGSPDYVPYIPQNYSRQMEPAGPPTGTTAYPYYTLRGPRDFFLNAPSTIGY